jgi:hypothetical protein
MTPSTSSDWPRRGSGEAGRDILAYLEARRQADQARTEHIIEALTHGMDAETANTHNPEEGDQ